MTVANLNRFYRDADIADLLAMMRDDTRCKAMTDDDVPCLAPTEAGLLCQRCERRLQGRG